jgi:predicted signal transduction protein with EAL and GGDEF domain
MHLIAEGVETQAQADRLRALGCADAQGYHFSRPVEPAAIEVMLRAAAESERAIAPFEADGLDSPALVVLGEGGRRYG